jgi:hypothetical protein
MNFTGAELLHRFYKQGKDRRSGAAIDKKFYGSVIPSRGQLSSISAQGLLKQNIRHRARVGNMQTSVQW